MVVNKHSSLTSCDKVIEVKNWLQNKSAQKSESRALERCAQIIDEIVKEITEAGKFQFQLTH